VISPGPDFAVVLRSSIAHGRRVGIHTALGVALGIGVHVLYCLLGIGALISTSILAFTTLKYLGAAYLAWIGIQALMSQASPTDSNSIDATSQPKPQHAFKTGFLTNVLNPKATIFFLAMFSVVVDPTTPIFVQALFGGWMMFATALWFCIVALFFSIQSIRQLFLRWGHWFERVMGAALIVLAGKLAYSKPSSAYLTKFAKLTVRCL
jgi:RhtB (resistance to homoserine/threonine) family protein